MRIPFDQEGYFPLYMSIWNGAVQRSIHHDIVWNSKTLETTIAYQQRTGYLNFTFTMGYYVTPIKNGEAFYVADKKFSQDYFCE